MLVSDNYQDKEFSKLQMMAQGGATGGVRSSKPSNHDRKGTILRAHDGFRMTEDSSEMSDMDKVKKSRLITAIKTPYTSTGRIDLNAYEKLVGF